MTTSHTSKVTLLFATALIGSTLCGQNQTPANAPPPPSAVAVAAALAAQDAADPIVLTIGAEKITKSQFERIFAQIVEQMPPERRAALRGPAPQARRQVAEQLAELKALAQEARVLKIDQTQEAQSQLALRSDQLLAGLMFQQISKNAGSEMAQKGVNAIKEKTAITFDPNYFGK